MFEQLIKFKELHEACAENYIFTGVTFIKDIGPWKVGDYVHVLEFNIQDGTMTSWDERNNVVNVYSFQLV